MESVSLKTILFGFVLQSVNSDFWNLEHFDQFQNFSIEEIVNLRSPLSCVAYCSSIAYPLIQKVAVQDDLCYCLNPRQIIIGGQQLISLSSVYSLSPESVCKQKGYEVLSELGIGVKYTPTKANWWNAKKVCNQDGGYLINLNTVEKITTILNMSLAYNVVLIHIGGYNLTTTFNWTRGGMINEGFWDPGEPSHHLLNENCMAIYKKVDTPLFGNLPCTHVEPYLCEILL